MNRDACIDQTAIGLLEVLDGMSREDPESRTKSERIVPIIAVASLRGRLDYDTAQVFKERLLTEIFPKMALNSSDAFDESKYWIIYGPLNKSGAKWLERLTMQLLRIVDGVRRNKDYLELGVEAQKRSLTLFRHDLYAGLEIEPKNATGHEFLAKLLSKSFGTQLTQIYSGRDFASKKTLIEQVAALCNFHSLVTNLYVLQDIVEN